MAPTRFDKWSAPSGEHLFELINVGRDISLVSCTASLLLLIGLFSTLIALFFGAIIGPVAAVVRKSFSEAIASHGHHHGGARYRHGGRSVLVFGRTPSKSGNTGPGGRHFIRSIACPHLRAVAHVRDRRGRLRREDYVQP